MIFSLLIAFSVLAIVSGNVYYFSHSPRTIPGDYSVWSYDSSSGDLNQLSTGKESAYSAWTMVSGAAYCNGRYYASAVDVPISAALLVTDVNSGKTQIPSDYNPIKVGHLHRSKTFNRRAAVAGPSFS